MKNKALLIVALTLVLALVGWYAFLRDTTPEPLLQKNTITEANATDGDVVNVLLQLRAVSLSGSIFTDPVFQSLQDHGSEIVPEPIGRPNPFAPLAASSSSSSSARSGAARPR